MQNINLVAKLYLESENDNDEIIENDDDYNEEFFLKENSDKEFVLFEFNNSQLNVVQEHLTLKDEEIDYYQDISIELPYDTMFILIKKELLAQDENNYLNQIDQLLKEKNELKQTNLKLTQNLQETQKPRVTVCENKKNEKDEKNSQSKPNELQLLLNTQKEKVINLGDNNKELQSQIDDYIKGFDQKRKEIKNKNNVLVITKHKLLELNQEVVKKANNVFKNDLFFQKNELINHIRNRTNSIMLQLINTNIQIDKLISENNALQNKLKSTQIKILTQETPKLTNIQEPNLKKTIIFPHENVELKINRNTLPNYYTTENKKRENFITTSMTIFPSQQERVKKETMILEIESNLYKLQKERDTLYNNLSKFPEFPKQKEIISQKNVLEDLITELNSKINLQKKKLRELNKLN